MKQKKKFKKGKKEPFDWKEKAISRSKQVKALNKRIRELILSRDCWKDKYTNSKRRNDKWEKDINVIKKKLNEVMNL